MGHTFSSSPIRFQHIAFTRNKNQVRTCIPTIQLKFRNTDVVKYLVVMLTPKINRSNRVANQVEPWYTNQLVSIQMNIPWS